MTKKTILIYIIGGKRSEPTITPIKAHYTSLITKDRYGNEYIVGLGIFYRDGGYHITDIHTGLDCTPNTRESGERCLKWKKEYLDEALKMLTGVNFKHIHENSDSIRFHNMIEEFKRRSDDEQREAD